MAAGRPWEWNLGEMRQAVTEDDGPDGEQLPSYPNVSSFTPINSPQACSESVVGGQELNTSTHKARIGPLRTQHSTAKDLPHTARLPKPARPAKGKSNDDRITESQGVVKKARQIKPRSEASISFHTETPSSSTVLGTPSIETVLNETTSCNENQPVDNVIGPNPQHSGLAVKYQSAYARDKETDTDSIDELRAKADRPLEVEGDNHSGAPRGAQVCNSASSSEPIAPGSENVEHDNFRPPQSAQMSQHNSRPDNDNYSHQGGSPVSLLDTDVLAIQNQKDSALLSRIFPDPQRPTIPGIETKLLDTEEESSDYGLIDDPTSAWTGDVFRPDWLTSYEDDPTLGSDMTCEPTNIQSSFVFTNVTGSAAERSTGSADASGELRPPESCFDDNEIEEGLVDLSKADFDAFGLETPERSSLRSASPKPQWLPSKVHIPAKSSAGSTEPEALHKVTFGKNGDALPFLRPSLPKPIRDRSPVLGLNNGTVLRTSFRIGEALNAGAIACREKVDAIVELYARVLNSEREANNGHKQLFKFGDLFTDKPPYLSGTYKLWKGVDLWDQDSRVFLDDGGGGKMCRAIGRIKRREQGGGCEMLVLSIWQIDWEDVGIAKGVVCS